MVKTQPVPLSKEKMDALIDASMDDDFYYMLFSVARKTGRRIGEYYDVQVKDLDFKNNTMVTKVLKRRKKVEKEAILDEETARLIKQYIARNNLGLDDYLFRKVSKRQIQNKVKYYARKAGIKENVMFHNFRHYFVTELFKKGWSYEKISKLTGHSTPGTLTIYDHSVASDIKDDALAALKDL